MFVGHLHADFESGTVFVVEDLGRTKGSVGIEAEAVVMLGAGSVCQAVGEGGVGIRIVGRELSDEGPNRLVLGNRKRSGGVQVGGGPDRFRKRSGRVQVDELRRHPLHGL